VADVTLKHFDELENRGGMFLYARKGLGVTAWAKSAVEVSGTGSLQSPR
jgi:hypothetical protein